MFCPKCGVSLHETSCSCHDCNITFQISAESPPLLPGQEISAAENTKQSIQAAVGGFNTAKVTASGVCIILAVCTVVLIIDRTTATRAPELVPVAAVQPEVTPVAEAPVPAPMPAPPPIGKWRSALGASQFDDSKTVDVTLPCEGSADGSLCLRCKEGKIVAYIDVGGVMNQVELEFGEYGSVGGATVRLRFDNEKAQTRVLSRSTSNSALFFSDAKSMIRQFLRHDKLAFEYNVFRAGPREFIFDLQGLSEAIKPLQTVCPLQ
jgi:hypothetical protein